MPAQRASGASQARHSNAAQLPGAKSMSVEIRTGEIEEAKFTQRSADSTKHKEAADHNPDEIHPQGTPVESA